MKLLVRKISHECLGKIIFALLALTIFSCHKSIAPPTAISPAPSPAQLAWHEMEMNAFVHFTTNTFTGKEWGYGDEDPTVFNPSNVNAKQWVGVLKSAGFKGVILTCKHHDGFCLWPSQYTEHSIKNSPWQQGKGDVVKDLSTACNSAGLKFGVYLSPWDRNRADYGKPAYVEYYRNQLKEIFTNYGPVFEMWFDGANGGNGYYGGAREARKINGATFYDWPNTLNLVRSFNPDIIFFSDAGPGVRWVGNERGEAGETNWCTISTDTLYAGKSGIEKLLNEGSENGNQWVPAETDVSIRPGWFYHASEDTLVKSPERLFEIYLSSVGRGSTLLLNVPPDQRGVIHENDVKALAGFRAILDSTFKTNLATNASITADHYRGDEENYSPRNLTDGNKETYWATDDDRTSGSIELTFDKPQTVKYVVLQEYVRLGQRTKKFDVKIWKDGNWQVAASGTTIGYKRILKIEPTETTKIQINIIDAKACPALSNLQVY